MVTETKHNFKKHQRKTESQIDAFTAHDRKRYTKSNRFKGVIRSQREIRRKILTRLSTDSSREIKQGIQRILNKPTVILNLMITTDLSEF